MDRLHNLDIKKIKSTSIDRGVSKNKIQIDIGSDILLLSRQRLKRFGL